MDINSKEYLDEQIDCVDRNFKGRRANYNKERFEIIKRFCNGAKTILSVGCGGHEPVAIGATHACDIAPNAADYLKLLGWNGVFTVCSCTNLPFPDKFFDVAVCSEVIEHLPTDQDVLKTFEELDRVAVTWIVTTPRFMRGRGNPEKTHKRDYSFKELGAILSKYQPYIYRKSMYFYVEKKKR